MMEGTAQAASILRHSVTKLRGGPELLGLDVSDAAEDVAVIVVVTLTVWDM